ncbi:MAG: site-2 protease family protein [Candidatus Omnitrophota bacterium]
MGLLSLLIHEPRLFIALVFLLLYSVIAHEVAHGWVAYLFGDDTALRNGRLTLNPARHIDPLGALMLIVAGFGWARPVPVNFYRLKPRRLGVFCVALAGCLTNILIAVVVIALLHFEWVRSQPILSVVLPVIARINVVLCAFNLIPIPPLDGSQILMNFLPARAQISLRRLEPFSFIILIVLLFTGLLNPAIGFMQERIYDGIGLLFGMFR